MRSDFIALKWLNEQDLNQSPERPLQRIREFCNRPNPNVNVVVTADMLPIVVDIPALEFIVFLRPTIATLKTNLVKHAQNNPADGQVVTQALEQLRKASSGP